MIRVMRFDRTVFELDEQADPTHLEAVKLLGLVQASDGLFLPRCDLAQYERGERPIRVEKPFDIEGYGTGVDCDGRSLAR